MRLFTGFPVGNQFTLAATVLSLSNGTINGLRWVPGVNLHVTACFIGEVSPDKLPRLKTATGEICTKFQPMTLNLQEICIWPKRKPYMVWALYEARPDFTAIYRKLEHKLTGVPGEGSVKPHVTLARFKDYTDIRQIQLTGTAFPETILCDRQILFESRLAPEGPAYFPLAEYPLGKPR
ncbi:MAG: RNA 2',3'-cyclic phosphodiesterase, partial [Bacteroidia bacterium]|nr:RNA 2',3'-cyclic phosphodiesterase [Bacteroidia bacterium]